ncbi:hypothetical protein PPERSA_06154 [Pseudocohnilembus persalinus]|uniref:Pentacotripeptide-repeat region of PRORP domain-containing protein n=1 Tax=Pseudocohnilembus persalinus TaxID=266149 RepID=A0A0V0QEA1_PSEPJ|nr:hypothetical protein PPERSA_06154 [Pseudocohnilembus persalinus]|eukprot:KRX00511.1 hypothetical protein PPERSA_06154 [Pseudocohnilembus persalinus]
MEKLTPQNMYQQMDSSFDGFFSKRNFSIKNFNFYIKVLGEQKKLTEAEETLNKMQIFKINPNVVSYNSIIGACSKSGNVKKAEQYFEEAVNKFGPNKHLYNTLINAYARKHNGIEADKILREMQRNNLEPDAPVITTIINAHYKSKNLDRCWELFEQVQKGEFKKLTPDTNLLSLMVEICAHTHDCEKAIKINKQLEDQPDFLHTTTTYNTIIKALASRKDYAEQALDYYEQMKISSVNMDMDTYIHTLKACSNIGDVNTAYNVLQAMKENKVEPNKYVYNQLMRVYAGAVEYSPMEEKTKDLYIQDAWKLLDQIKNLGLININILNSFLTIFVKANRPEELEGLVLPLYDNFKIPMDQYTYQHILEIYHNHRDLKTVYRVYKQMDKENIDKTWWTLNYVLDSAIRAEDVDIIVEILQKFQKIKREPKIIYLKRLGEADYLPDPIFNELQKFSKKFGQANKKEKFNKNYKKSLKDSWL